MASLALVVSLILLILLIIGPMSYLVCSFGCVPKFIKYLLSILCISIGVWAIFIPVPLFKIIGIVDFSIGLKIALGADSKTTQA